MDYSFTYINVCPIRCPQGQRHYLAQQQNKLASFEFKTVYQGNE